MYNSNKEINQEFELDTLRTIFQVKLSIFVLNKFIDLTYLHDEVKPYETTEASKKTQVSNMFDNIAPYYDFLNRFLTFGIDQKWRKKGIKLLANKQPKIILDVATGTADIAIEAAAILKPDKIYGIDISKEMLEIGKQKVNKKGLDNLIVLEVGDSEKLPYQDNTFDAITVAFGVRNFENLEKGLTEMYRVLKQGGQLMVLEISMPIIFPFKQLFNLYFKYILPFIGKMTSKDPKAYKYLYDSVQAFPNGKDFVSILAKSGYKSNKCIPLTLGICSIYHGEK